MKKAIGQTVRELKRGVNKNVLKVPGIEQKVLDATSNEPWGPHGSLLADIAYATRNYQEYQIIMSVVWKRINDTGKNWHHVYKDFVPLQDLDEVRLIKGCDEFEKVTKTPDENIDRMVKEFEETKKKLEAFSRRRKFHEEKDVDSINDRNEHFNKKIERAFGKYTLEIKNNLERATALPD